MTDLTELAEKLRWADFIRPKSLLETCAYEGRLSDALFEVISAKMKK